MQKLTPRKEKLQKRDPKSKEAENKGGVLTAEKREAGKNLTNMGIKESRKKYGPKARTNLEKYRTTSNNLINNQETHK